MPGEGIGEMASRTERGGRRGISKRGLVLVVAAIAACLAVYAGLAGSGAVAPGELVEVGRGVDFGARQVGEEFVVSLEAGRGGDPSGVALVVRSRSGRVLWESVPGESFVSAARGEEEVRRARMHFFVEDDVEERCTDQTVDSFRGEGAALFVGGRLLWV